MIIEQLVPAKSPTMTEGTIVSWRIKPGDLVKSGDVIAEIQTDKAIVEWEALDGGHVADILIPANTLVQVNQVAALFTTKPGEDVAAAREEAKQTNAALAAKATSGSNGNGSAPVPVPAAPVSAPAAPAKDDSKLPKGVRISPVAAKLAASLGVDVRLVRGSGPDGRIVRKDVEDAAKSGIAKLGAGGGAAAKPEKPKLKVLRQDGASNTVGLSAMRQVIGKRLVESKTQIPHFQVADTIDAGPLAALREQVNQLDGVKITVNDLVVRACALALRVHPKINATYHNDRIVQHDQADISIAVAIPDGLITPILAKAHSKNVRQISDEVRVLAKKAQEGKLQPSEFQGGTFTISNLGMFGIASFTAIINPPQVAILAVAGIKDVPVVKHGAIVPGKTMTMTLSGDHRAIDGADGAAFLKTLKELLENPATLLV